MTRLLAIDPGGIKPGSHSGTGYAVLDTEGMKLLHMSIDNHGPYECNAYYEALREQYHPDVLLCEDFIPRWGNKFELDSVYLIGGLQSLYNGALKLIKPADHMSRVSKDKLTQLMKEHKIAIGEGHSRMALSLCVYYAAFKLQDAEAIHYLLGDRNE